MQPWESYLPEAEGRQRLAKERGEMESGGEDPSLLYVSSLPWLHYSALRQPTPFPPDSNPRISWGRFAPSGGKYTLPVTLLVNHALVDGLHMGQFYEALGEEQLSFVRRSRRAEQ